jgi:helix-turn-helix protein
VNSPPNEARSSAANRTVFEANTEAVSESLPPRNVGGKTSRLLAWRKAVVASDLSGTQKLVALVLSLHMNSGGSSCFPSQETIAEEASLGVRAVRDALKTLDGRGFIAREGGRFRGDVTRYRASLTAERRKDVPPFEEVTRHDVPPSTERKAASDDAKGGISFHERRHDMPTRTSGGRPEDVLPRQRETTPTSPDAVAPAGHSRLSRHEEPRKPTGGTMSPAEASLLDEAAATLGKYGPVDADDLAAIAQAIGRVDAVWRVVAAAVALADDYDFAGRSYTPDLDVVAEVHDRIRAVERMSVESDEPEIGF